MPRGKNLTYKVRTLIIDTHEKHPEWKAPKVLSKVWQKLKKEDPTIPPTWPSLSAVQKVLREYHPQDDERDKAWSIAAMGRHGIPSEALPVILRVWGHFERESAWYERQDREEWLTKVMTIRVAQWIARLYYVFPERFGTPSKDESAAIILFLLAVQYASLERIVEPIGYPDNYEDMLTLWKPDTELARFPEKGSLKIEPQELLGIHGIDKKLLRGGPLGRLVQVEAGQLASIEIQRREAKHERKHSTKK